MNWTMAIQEQRYVFWQPFATSTPLKTVPNQLLKEATTKTLIQKLLNVHKISSDPQSKPTETRDFISKKSKRSRLCDIYDVSSSSDEDLYENKRPVIKINSRKNRSLGKTKKLKNQVNENEGKTVDNKTNTKQVAVKVRKKAGSAEVLFYHENCQTENKGVEQNSHLENSCVSSGDGSKIFDEANSNKNSVNDPQSDPYVLHKENVRITKKGRQQREVTQIKRTKVKGVTRISKISQLKDDTENNPKKLPENRKVPKRLLSKDLHTAKGAEPGKKLSNRKLFHELSAQKLVTKKPKTPLHSGETNINLSHQLFSDSREQECINTLKLSSEEINVTAESTTNNLWQKSKQKTHNKSTLSHPSIKYDDEKEEDKPKKPRKRKQKPEEFGPSENTKSCRASKCKRNSGILENKQKSVKKSNKDVVTRNIEETEETTKKLEISNKKEKSIRELNKGSEVENIKANGLENIRLTKKHTETHEKEENQPKRPRRKSHKPKEFWLPENVRSDKENIDKMTSTVSIKSGKSVTSVTKLKKTAAVKKIQENNVTKIEATKNIPLKGTKTKKKGEKNIVDTEPNSDLPVENPMTSNCKDIKSAPTDSVKSGKDTHKNTDKVTEEETEKREATADNKPVFNLLSELPFNSNTSGCAIAQCWNKKNFKCGVFKVQVNSQLTHKTSCNNSHLGGVVVRGKLKMNIGDREVELKEGDMAFVPPLTEWKATNICDYEAVFYYWCGRFKD